MPVTYPAAPEPFPVITGDFNGDGNLDLATINFAVPSTISIFLGNGDGTFQPRVDFQTAGLLNWLIARHFNNDGKLDLATANLTANTAVTVPVSFFVRYTLFLRYSGRLIRIPAPPHMKELLQRIQAAAQSALADRKMIPIVEEGTLEMGVCHANEFRQLEAWCKERALDPAGFGGPRDRTDVIERLEGKIRVEQNQLSPGYANVLVIKNDHFFNHSPTPAEMIYAIEEELWKHNQLAIVVVRGQYGCNYEVTPQIFEEKGHRFERRMECGRVQQTLLFSNRYAQVGPSDGLRAKLLRAFFGR